MSLVFTNNLVMFLVIHLVVFWHETFFFFPTSSNTIQFSVNSLDLLFIY